MQKLAPQIWGAAVRVRQAWHRRPRLNILLTVLVLTAGLMVCPWVHASELLNHDSENMAEAERLQDNIVNVSVTPEGNGSVDGNQNSFEREVETDSNLALELQAEEGSVIGSIRVNGETPDESDLTGLLGEGSGRLTLEDVEDPVDLTVQFMTKEEYSEAKAGAKSSEDTEKEDSRSKGAESDDDESVDTADNPENDTKGESSIGDSEEENDGDDAEDVENSGDADSDSDSDGDAAGGSNAGSGSDADEEFEGPDDAAEYGEDNDSGSSVEDEEGTGQNDGDASDSSADEVDGTSADDGNSSERNEESDQESGGSAEPGLEDLNTGENGEDAADAGTEERGEEIATIQVGKGAYTETAEETSGNSEGRSTDDAYKDTPRTGDSFPALCLLLLAASLTLIGILACSWLRKQRG